MSNFSQYRSNHFDYDYEDPSEDTPTEDSVEKSLATPQPIGLEYPEEFFYDHTRDSFLDEKGSLLSGIEVLNRVYTEHCNTIHWLKGIKLKWKQFLQSKSTAVLSIFIILLTWILKRVFGRTIEENAEAFAYLKGYKKEDYKKLNTDSLNFFGYKASKSVIILFCVLSILGAWWQYCTGASSDYITYIGTSNYLTIVHSLFLLWLLDVVVPYFIFEIINILIKIRTFISLMRLKT